MLSMPDQESKMSTSMSRMKETRQRAPAPKQDNVVPEAAALLWKPLNRSCLGLP